MRAMILAAGFGERLRPLTSRRAKPSIPLLNRPLILRTLDYLHLHGVREAVINLHHLPRSIRDVVTAGRPADLRVTYSEETDILGTAGGLKKAGSHFRGGGTLTLINSDFIVDCDLGAALQAHRRSGALATMILVPAEAGQLYGVVELADDRSIHRISGRPSTRPGRDGPGYTFTGIHLLEPEILDHIPPGIPCCINKDIYPPLIEAGRAIHGFVHRGQWLEFGTPQLFLEGSFAMLRAGGDPPLTPPPGTDGPGDGEAPPPGTAVEPPFLLGPGCTFGEGASCAGGLILGARVELGPGSKLQRTIVHDDVRIGAGVELVDCLVDSGVVLPADAGLTRAMVVPWTDDQAKDRPLQRLGDCGIAEF
jgi:mannose-1-phosphate guanylyltransferase